MGRWVGKKVTMYNFHRTGSAVLVFTNVMVLAFLHIISMLIDFCWWRLPGTEVPACSRVMAPTHHLLRCFLLLPCFIIFMHLHLSSGL